MKIPSTNNSKVIKNKTKFYYYSPVKLKLVEIQNLSKKAALILSLFSLFLISISMYIGTKLSSSNAYQNQNTIFESQYKKELELVEQKYQKLAVKYEDILDKSNDLRMAVNLEKLDLDELKYGIGGSEFLDLGKYSSSLNSDKLTSIYGTLNSIETKLKLEQGNFKEIENKLNQNKDFFNKIPAIRPVNSPYGDRFGMRFHPILKRKRMHHGLDFLANTGENVYSPGDGVVKYVGTKGGYGKVIKIDHGFGYETIFAHLSKYKVKRGQKVNRGDIIALSGNSGSLSTGPHLHYEVRHNGISLNPRNFIYDDTKLFASVK